jgi:hypothetical protein
VQVSHASHKLIYPSYLLSEKCLVCMLNDVLYPVSYVLRVGCFFMGLKLSNVFNNN